MRCLDAGTNRRAQFRGDVGPVCSSRAKMLFSPHWIRLSGHNFGHSEILAQSETPKRSYLLQTIKVILVGERGFEPPTPWSRTRCSTRLSHSPTLPVPRVELRRSLRTRIHCRALSGMQDRNAPRSDYSRGIARDFIAGAPVEHRLRATRTNGRQSKLLRPKGEAAKRRNK